MQPQNHQPKQQNLSRGQNIGRVKALYVAHIVLGILAILFQLGAIINQSGVYFMGAGIWAGLLVSEVDLRGDVKMQVAATGAVCSQLQKVAILLCQFRLI